MAEVTIVFDTDTKKMKVSIGGVELADVDSVNLWKSYYDAYRGDDDDRFDLNITTEVEKDANGMKQRTYLYASDSNAAKEASKAVQLSKAAFEGFVQHVETKGGLNSAVAAYLG